MRGNGFFKRLSENEFFDLWALVSDSSRPGPFESGVARAALQRRPLHLPMGWGVGEELTKAAVQGKRGNHLVAMEKQLASLQEELAWMRSRAHHAPLQSVSKGMGKGKGQGKGRGASQGPAPNPPAPPPQGPRHAGSQSETPRREGHPHSSGDKVFRMPGIQVDHTERLPLLSDTLGQATGCLKRWHSECTSVCQDSGTVPGKSYARAASCAAQLDTVKEKLRDRRQPGARLDSAAAGVKKATARREKAEETLKQAQEALERARLEETRAQQELEEAKAAACPQPPPDNPPPGSVSLSSTDVAGLISFFQELAEEREAAPGAELPSKKGRTGPYGETPNTKAVKDAEVRAKLERGQACLGFMLAEIRANFSKKFA